MANFWMESSTPISSWNPETSYRGIGNYHNNRTGIKSSAMNELRSHINFTQLRFHCSKQQGRTFHVTTVANNTGEAVVQYFSDQTKELPFSCYSFKRLVGDNSQLATQCEKWGRYSSSYFVGKWGHSKKKGQFRMYDHAAFIRNKCHWLAYNGNWLCDDDNLVVSQGDFWKIYVR